MIWNKESLITAINAKINGDWVGCNIVFDSRMVKIGLENGDRVQINSGLKPGDIVVISGAYLLNSEFLFKNGATPMDGMKM